ncbi:MarR family winged helix-turn-helix transcriptional regulator [Mycolicibacterium conceptionense]|uniref:Transcriptional regulator n=1 Tax=Mycolicibacterium conceptionense TaxID=451644 RepID=A0A0U1DHQ0_9MYCO|nr:MarR family transcriptional regulator [Mycolicibacterium conceptionense]CQD15941.1 transcriptional regulator [Mycolicibacterium conceptionense]
MCQRSGLFDLNAYRQVRFYYLAMPHHRRRTPSDLPGLDLAEQRSWQNYLEAALRFETETNRRLANAHQLSVLDLRVLDALRKSDGAFVRMGNLAAATGALPGHLTKRVQGLEKRLLVRRERCTQDRRSVLATITDRGNETASQAIATYAECVKRDLVGSLSRTQLAAIEVNCRRISHGLNTHTAERAAKLTACRLPGLDDGETRCWRAFFESSTGLVTRLNRTLTKTLNLNLVDVFLLDMLSKSQAGAVRMTDLANAFDLAPSRVTQQIDRLETHGLAGRVLSPTDRRVVLATVTDAALARLELALFHYAKEIRKHYLDPMSRQQMIALGDACRRITTPSNNVEAQHNWTSDTLRQ